MNVPALITYPARPIQGGRLELAPTKRGVWYAEPKLNDWRALMHTPTGTMWNRHGALLTNLVNLPQEPMLWETLELIPQPLKSRLGAKLREFTD